MNAQPHTMSCIIVATHHTHTIMPFRITTDFLYMYVSQSTMIIIIHFQETMMPNGIFDSTGLDYN